MFRTPRAQRRGRPDRRQSRRRAELRLVGGQAQPAPRQPQPRGRGPRRRRGRAGLDARPGAGDPGPGRWMARWQAWLFFPLLLLEGLAPARGQHPGAHRPRPHGRQAPMRHRVVEACCSSRTSSATVGAAVRGDVTGARRWLFVVVHQALFGLYLGCRSRPTTRACRCPTAEDELDFLRQQVLTSRNVPGSWLVDLALGGLNYQIEHHLFPNMPRRQPAPGPADRPGVLRRAGHLVRGDRADRVVPAGAGAPARGGPAAARGLRATHRRKGAGTIAVPAPFSWYGVSRPARRRAGPPRGRSRRR